MNDCPIYIEHPMRAGVPMMTLTCAEYIEQLRAQLAAESARREVAEVLARNAEKDAAADRVALVLAYSRAEDAEARCAELEEAVVEERARSIHNYNRNRNISPSWGQLSNDDLTKEVIRDQARLQLRADGILRPLPAPVEVANG